MGTSVQSQGTDWGKLIQQYGPTVVSLLAGIYGAYNQNQTNKANQQSLDNRNEMLQGYINPLLMRQQQQNPYAAAISQFIGRPQLGMQQGTADNPYPIPNDWRKIRYDPITGQYKQPAIITTHDGRQVPIGPTANPQGGYDAPTGYQASIAPVSSGQGYINDQGQIVPSGANSMPVLYDQSPPPPPDGTGLSENYPVEYWRSRGQIPPDYYNQQVAQFKQMGFDDQTADQQARMMAANTFGNTQLLSEYDAAHAGDYQTRINEILARSDTSPDIARIIQQPGYGSMLQAYQMNQGQIPNPFQGFLDGTLQPSSGGPFTPGSAGGDLSPTQFGPGGFQLTLPSGYPTGTPDPNYPWTPTPTPLGGSPSGIGGMPGQGPILTLPGQNGPGGAAGSGGMDQMYRYQNPGDNAFTYKPPTLGNAPSVTGLQGMNVGQDALMQMMRATPGPGGDPALSLNSQQLGEQFNNSDLFKALEPIDQRLIDRNVSQLRAGTGSLGQRFGTAMAQNEARLREQLGQDVLARNAQIASQSFEAGKGRELQAAGLRLNAAQGLTSAMGQSDVLNQQAKLANQQYAAQYGLHGADILNQAGQFNAQQRMAQNQFAAGQGNQFNNFMLQALGLGNQIQQGNMGNQINLISLLAGLPIGQQQANQIPGAIQDASMMWMMLPYLNRASQPPTART